MFTRSLISSPLGELHAAFSKDGLCYLGFHDQAKNPLSSFGDKHQVDFVDGSSDYAHGLESELNSYFDGNAIDFTTPIDLMGTDFQKRVWRSLNDIRLGQRRTYAEQSAILGDPLAIRAVSSANGLNPISILIPCHRVVGSDGNLTGYAGGLDRKRRLLDLESKMVGRAVQVDLFSTFE